VSGEGGGSSGRVGRPAGVLADEGEGAADVAGGGFGEEAVEAEGGEVGEGLIVEEAGVHDAVVGEVVDDLVDEADLIGVVAGVGEVAAEGALFLEGVEVVEVLNEEQDRRAAPSPDRVGDAAGPEGVPDAVDLMAKFSGEHTRIIVGPAGCGQ
jgi:hypothetical protein